MKYYLGFSRSSIDSGRYTKLCFNCIFSLSPIKFNGKICILHRAFIYNVLQRDLRQVSIFVILLL
jgi:hypothetical protein